MHRTATRQSCSPPGYMTIQEVCEYLEMSRQNFYQSGLPEVFTSWQIGRTILYSYDDITMLYHYLVVRKKMIEAGALPANHKIIDFDMWEDLFILGGLVEWE